MLTFPVRRGFERAGTGALLGKKRASELSSSFPTELVVLSFLKGGMGSSPCWPPLPPLMLFRLMEGKRDRFIGAKLFVPEDDIPVFSSRCNPTGNLTIVLLLASTIGGGLQKQFGTGAFDL